MFSWGANGKVFIVKTFLKASEEIEAEMIDDDLLND